jgi:hypothetical protein
MKTLLIVVAFAAVITGCQSTPVRPIATVPVTQRVTDVRYVPIRQDLTAQTPAPEQGASFGGLWAEVKAYRAGWTALMARFSCIAAIQGASTSLAAGCVADPGASQP